MAEELQESKIEITLDGNVITLDQLEEAKKDTSVRIIEDSNHKGQYRTLKRMVD